MNLLLAAFPLWPEQASTIAPKTDALFIFLCVVSGATSLMIFVTIFYLAIRYRRRPDNELAQEEEAPKFLEVAWIVVPFIFFIMCFVWGSWLYFQEARVPNDALQVYATGKQWMWKFQHPEGQREINTLHVPVNRPVKITVASEDVIHDLFIPAFRVKVDVLPNRYRTLWFQATKTGQFHIFCSQYCGTLHSEMIGWVDVMEPTDYQKWLAGGFEGSLASQGERLFAKYTCNTCHLPDNTGRGPTLVGVYSSNVVLSNGAVVKADDNYVRESILSPQAKIVKGYGPIMPTFQGQVTEDDLVKLLAYIKSLAAPSGKAPAPPPAAGTPAPSKEPKS